MKNTISFLILVVMIFACITLTSCKKTEETNEVDRAKMTLEAEFVKLSRLYSQKVITYYSHTFYTVEEQDNGGHKLYGKIYFKDRYGGAYVTNFDASVDKNSWAPKFSISAIDACPEVFEEPTENSRTISKK